MRTRWVATWLAAALLMALMPINPASSAPLDEGEPSIRLLSGGSEAVAIRYGRRAPILGRGPLVAVTGGPLDLRVRRASFADPVTVTQMIHSEGGVTQRSLPPELLDGWRGLDNFLRVKATDRAGRVVLKQLATFCPNNEERQRLDDSGPAVPTFPYACHASPRLLGMTWGVDVSWAVGAAQGGLRLPVPDGSYSVEISIARAYRELFGIALEDALVTMQVRVRTETRCRHKCWMPHGTQASEQQMYAGVPDMPDPDDSVLPDLRTLPAFSMHVSNRRSGRSFLEFGATVWVGGASPVVVEGFRRGEEPVMDAYQYFYRDGEPVGRAPAGTFEYDLRDTHQHWHILQFVRYQLLDADGTEPVRSAKESFCLVPTDAVDLSTDEAALTAEREDLHTSCGGPGAIWIRETLPVGWGDTYYQGGRYGFEVTDLPNGTYFVEVAANPDGLLHEQDGGNNLSLREVQLRGVPGNRRVVVPDPYGIDGDDRGYWR